MPRRRRSSRRSSRRYSRPRSRRTSRRSASRRTYAKPRLKSSLLRKLHVVAPGAAPTMKSKGSAGVRVSFGRDPAKDNAIVACASYGAAKKAVVECDYDRNPRRAMAGALRKLAGKLEARSGVFAGFGNVSGRRRRRRRR